MNGSAALECADPKSLGSTIGTGNLEVDLDERLVTVDGNPVKLTQREYEIFELLSSRKGTIVTKEMFLDRLYAGGHEPEHKIIDIFVCKLRQKLAQATGGSHYIEIFRDPAVRSAKPEPSIEREGGGATPLR
jgi:two-component system cell cycle response regulator CtrA